MEFKETVLNIDALKWMKDNIGISETEENELKELELLIEQREKMLEMLQEMFDEWCETGIGENKLSEYMLKAKQLIKEATTI